MYIIIAGCGRVGSALAARLSMEGHNVAVIDPSDENLERLGSGCNCAAVTGLPIDEDVLRQAGIEQADAVIAVTPDDNTNLMAAQIARQLYRVPQVITRAYDSRRKQVFDSFGIDFVCPTDLVADSVFAKLIPGGKKA
ncbi:MAG: TrkA family potassium uptake protein [Oscillibacter sp.]|jgi:trk system potassium uptake protein TrkA|nr:TrkA family potassium uptake protein [Oscillibacter sp.]